MAVSTWPAALPQLLERNSYEEEFANNAMRTATDIGPKKIRRRTTANPRKVSGAIYLNPTQLGTFETFYETTLIDGTLRFNWVDPRDGTTAVEMLFAAPPKVRSIGYDYQVTMQLEIMP